MRCALLFAASLLPGLAAAMPSLDLADAAQLARAGACVASVVDPAATALYQSVASASGVDGSLRKYALARDQAGRPVPAGAPAWDAAVLLEDRDPALRALYTGQREGERLHTVPLDWNALDQAGQALLSTGADGAADAAGASRVAYLRGARGMEAGLRQGRFRGRASLLGATVVGAPLWVGAPAPAGAGPRYPAFLAAHAGRPAVVYLQANDGMLHGFDAASGSELFAYLPLALRPQWPRLPTAAHASSPYAEGGLAAGDALVRGSWKTVLAGALGGGAQGVFALDVSNPARFAGGDGALFEFTDGDDPDIGNIFQPPALARLRTGGGQVGDFIVVASGYNNQRADGEGRSNPAGPGALFLLSLDKDPAAPWQPGRNYFKFLLPAGSAALPNGLAQPALIASPDGSGSVRLAYAGDLQGRLWRLDFGAGQPPWPQAIGSGQPLFAAASAAGRRQPISSAPRALYRADGSLLLLFGTGSLLDAADAQDKSVQSLYGVADTQPAATLTRADLAVRKLVTDDTGAYRLEDGAAAASSAGWLLDFPVPGERVLASPLVENGVATIATMLPGASACAANGSLYLLDAQNGLAPPGVPAPWLAMPMQPARTLNVIAERQPAQPGEADDAGAGVAQTRHTVIGGRAGGQPVASVVRRSRAGRLGWREVVDWEAMRDAASQR